MGSAGHVAAASPDGLLDYRLPAELIAQQPAPVRSESRLMVVDRGSGCLHHARFCELGAWLPAGALLVANDSKVIPARLHGHKVASGGAVEVLVLGGERCRAIVLTRSSKGLKLGQSLEFAGGVSAVVAGPVDQGRCELDFAPLTLDEVLGRIGELPLPPYILRPDGPSPEDAERYQTVYARSPGSVAAPTAGLHFTRELVENLKIQGFGFTNVTLHVGPGTFIPVRAALADHRMEEERFEIGQDAAAAIGLARSEGRPVVAVGTTTVRTLESAADAQGLPGAGPGRTSLFIRPGHRFRAVDALVTNFHLPGSTLLALVMALAGEELLRKAYETAVAERYRFYSFGDAMLIR